MMEKPLAEKTGDFSDIYGDRRMSNEGGGAGTAASFLSGMGKACIILKPVPGKTGARPFLRGAGSGARNPRAEG